MKPAVCEKQDIVDRLDFLLEDTTTLAVYSSQIMGDITDAKKEILKLRKQLSPPI